DTDSALASLQAAIQQDPEEQMALYNAGYVHMLKGEYDTALTFFQRAEKIDADIFELNFQTGRVLFELGQTETARSYLEHAVSIKPDAGIAYRYLGDCYAAAERIEDAVNAYKTALKRRPDDADAISALGYFYETLGENAEIALMFCQQATEMAPENGLFHYRLGWIYYNRNQAEQAAAAFENARECGYDPGDTAEPTPQAEGQRR
ncbi:MAG: tetratricopeptide repeat protein, partial [Thermodesulfobacteriota bacterium]